MRRHLLGIISLTLILIGAAGFYQSRSPSGDVSPMAGYLARAGIMLGAIWLAWPQIQQVFRKFPPWLLGAIGVAVLVLIVSSKLVWAVGLVLIAIVGLKFLGQFLKGREKPRSTRPRAPTPRKE